MAKSTKLAPDTILRRIIGINIGLNSIRDIEIASAGSTIILPNYALVVIEAFTHPTTLRDALKKLQVKGHQDWMETTGLVYKLYNAGILTEKTDNEFVADIKQDSFGAAPIHIKMLNDKMRTDSFINALKYTVKPGDIVVDIGTGTGVLAIAAARAGAKRVYAIEAGAIADVAEAVIADSEVAEKITVIRRWSTKTDLPEKADVLVSEIIGNDPFGENILQTFKDAKKRLLKPRATILPGRLKAFALPVVLPADFLLNRIPGPGEIKNWREWYQTDFSALNKFCEKISNPLVQLSTYQTRKLKISGEPILLADIDFNEFEDLAIRKDIIALKKNEFNAFLIYFEAETGTTILSNHPRQAVNTNSWLNPIWYMPEIGQLATGANYSITYTYGDGKHSDIQLTQLQ